MAQEELTEIIKMIEPSTILILTYDEEGIPLGQGSGFFISEDGEVITNRHVILNAAYAEIKTVQGEIYPITHVLAEDSEGDIIRVLVDIPQEKIKPLTVSVSTPEPGERIVVIGNPFGLEGTVADGIVSAVRDAPNFGTIIQITAPISPGSSGSPVVKNGKD
jgi:serine protease Do